MPAVTKPALAFLMMSCLSTPSAVADGGTPFTDRTVSSGLGFVHFNGMTGDVLMPETVGSGVALIDYDRDGDLDVFFVQGDLLGQDVTMDDAMFQPRYERLTHRLYRNDTEGGELRFTDVTDETIPGGPMQGMGAVVADVDGDGWEDILVTGLHSRRLLMNLGDGRGFVDATEAWGLQYDEWSVPATFFDYDGDGDLDLFVGDYVDYRYPPPRNCTTSSGFLDYCSPKSFKPLPDHLYRNDGDRFVEVTEEAGLMGAYGPALGAIATDFDGDGLLDLYIANDGFANQLWINQGDGTFVDDALFAGVALNGDGMAEASMGVDAADFDGDGDEDIFITHFKSETNTLYVNDGSGLFDDKSNISGLGRASFPATGFGTTWFDYDNDGWLDLLAANGAVYRTGKLLEAGDPYPLHETNQLFRNLGDGRFEEITEQAGEPFRLSQVSRGAAFGDLDRDGDTDVVISNNAGKAQLLINEVGNRSSWIGIRFRDHRGAALSGARLEVDAGGRTLWRRSRRDGSYASSNDPDMIVGLGAHREPVDITVYWPDGQTQRLAGLEPGRYHTLARPDPR